MQGEAIVKRILEDAKLKADECVNEAYNKAKQILDVADNYTKKKREEVENSSNEKQQQISDRYETLSKIEGNKIILNKKQNILKDLKLKALNVLLSLQKKEKLALIEKLLKANAEESEQLLLNIEGVDVKDVEEMEVVKKLKLKVSKNKNAKQVGIILSSTNCDKNLLFSSLIENAFEQEQGDINKLLF